MNGNYASRREAAIVAQGKHSAALGWVAEYSRAPSGRCEINIPGSRTIEDRSLSVTRVYMDANATTPLLPEVMEAMRPYWMERFGNASSIHLDGQQAHSAVDRARATLAEFFNCHDAEVVFNSGGTEGDNTAIFGLLRPGDHFITTSIEHSAILRAAERMAAFGVESPLSRPPRAA